MEKGNFVYSGWRANGFVALVGLLVLIAGGIALCVFGSDVMDPRIGLRTAMLVCGVCLFFISMFCFKGFMLLEPNEARVVMFFGKYKGTFYETGFWCIIRKSKCSTDFKRNDFLKKNEAYPLGALRSLKFAYRKLRISLFVELAV